MAAASGSLTKMSVPSGGGGSNQTLLMPKLQYRFRVRFIGFGRSGSDTSDLTRQVIDCNRPQITFEPITLPIYNSTIYLAGRHSWNELTINLRDDITNNVSKLVGAQLQKQLDFIEQASAAAGADYKFTAYIDILDGNNGVAGPVVLESWECYGCFLQMANYQTLNYGTNEPVTIALTIRYDNAVQSKEGATDIGVGINSPSINNTGSTATVIASQ